MDNEAVSASSVTHTESKFVNANQTAYSKFKQMTAYNRMNLFKNDVEAYKNPYTQDKKEYAVKEILGSRNKSTFV
ncbi:hypothetical protein BVY03_05765 [bacterium K02(2017)]|nr:hypothetical protein BVY03_05765 [bacterium K02(2017)]